MDPFQNTPTTTSNAKSILLLPGVFFLVKISNLIRFKHEVIHVESSLAGDSEPDFQYETAMRLVVVRDETESFHFAFLPRHVVVQAQEVNQHNGKFCFSP
jgi:hypothetical protein